MALAPSLGPSLLVQLSLVDAADGTDGGALHAAGGGSGAPGDTEKCRKDGSFFNFLKTFW